MEAMPEDMWTSYKNLNKIVNQALAQPSSTSLTDLELCLRKYKQNFASILKNPTRNERNRAVLLAGLKEGFVTVKSNNRIMLSKDLVDETLIISDMYDLNEFIALQLLCTAQRQLIKHPGLSRGLVAILLYYDGRKAIASTLRDLFQVTSGFSWETDVQKEVTSLITSFTQSLVKDTNILWKILDSIIGLDISKETVLLTKNRAFGPNKQKNQVLELFEDTRLALATSLYNWSAQRGLPSNIIIKLIDILSNYTSLEASGSIDDVMMTMLMALLYSYDTSVLQRRVDNILVQNLNIINEIGAAQQIHNAIYQVEKKNGLNSLTMLTFGLALANLRHIPQNLQPFISKVIDYDEQLVDDAISKNVFEFMYYQILEVGILYKNEFFYRRMHRILTDFIEYMHSKVSELRGRADDTARTVISFMKEGIEPPQNLDNNFEMLMRCIGKFYKKNRAGLSLCVEFWGVEMKPNCLRSTTRAVSLFKFLRLAGELLPTTLFVPYLKMIAGLTSCERSARNAFNLLKQTGLSGSMTLSWEHFFGSLARYYS
ncbi:nuclear pore complex protein Nup205-like [Teleopsis dalmanni]|nr:nuclear pore complex protein Nup205-like [Teleopsis dalmanni]